MSEHRTAPAPVSFTATADDELVAALRAAIAGRYREVADLLEDGSVPD